MAKKKQQPVEVEQQSIGNMLKSKGSSRDVNLALKAKLIEEGKHPAVSQNLGLTQKERNLALKAKLNGE